MKQPFEVVVQTYGPTVLRVCRVVVGAHDADDAWSETFLAALRAYPELPVEANVEAWLVTIAHHKSIDLIRARQRRATPLATVPEAPADAQHPDHDPRLEAIQSLPPKQRQTVAYHYLAGLPYAAVAEIVGGTPEAARRAASDGIKALRARYDASGATASPGPQGDIP